MIDLYPSLNIRIIYIGLTSLLLLQATGPVLFDADYPSHSSSFNVHMNLAS